MSGDGMILAGNAHFPDGDHGCVWTDTTALDLGPQFFPYCISEDGTVVGGVAQPFSQQSGALWSLGLGVLVVYPNGSGSIYALNGSGGVWAGTLTVSFPGGSTGPQAARGTLFGGTTPLGTFGYGSIARSINADGAVVIGDSQLPSGQSHVFRWTAATGMVDLGTANVGFSTFVSSAIALSGDGLVFACYGGTPSGRERSYRYFNGVFQDLGVLGNNPLLDVNARSMSRDGNVVVGEARGPQTEERGFVWTQRYGMTELNAYVEARGINLAGWNLLFTSAINRDGSALAGQGLFNGVRSAWVIRGLPLACGGCAADYNCSGSPDFQDIFEFLNAWFAGNSAADFNGLDGVMLQDIFDFLNAWFAGC